MSMQNVKIRQFSEKSVKTTVIVTVRTASGAALELMEGAFHINHCINSHTLWSTFTICIYK